MKISVIVAVYNAAKTLQRCIDSINAQSYLDRELIIIDGGSTDGTVDIIRANASKIAHWESEHDRGIYHAWNKGVAKAVGEWVCFIGSDDVFHTDSVIETVVPRLSGIVVYGDALLVKPDGSPVRLMSHPWNRALFCEGQMFPHVGTFHLRSILTGFDESFRIAGDHEFMMRALKERDPAYLPMVFCNVQIGGLSQNIKYFPDAVNEILRALKKNGYRRFTRYTLKLTSKAYPLYFARLFLSDNMFATAHHYWRSYFRRREQ